LDGTVPIPKEPATIRDTPARHEVRALLEQLIVSGALAPGTRLTDADLLRLTSSSRGPLREALNELALVGLVAVRPRQWTEVTRLDPATSLQALQIEGAVMRQALVESIANLTDRDREQLRERSGNALQTEEAFKNAIRSRDHRVLISVFVERTENPEYLRVINRVAPLVDRQTASDAASLSPATRLSLLEVVDRAIGSDVDGAVAAWDAFTASLSPSEAMVVTTEDPAAAREPGTLRDKAAAVIEAEIYAGTLVPGELLPEADLMRWLGVSRTPVREALTVLSHKGVVDLGNHRTARVSMVTAEGAVHVLRALAVLRSLEVELAIARDPDGAASAVESAAGAWNAAQDSAAIVDAALELMAPLNPLCANPLLVQVASSLGARIAWHARNDASALAVTMPERLAELATALLEGDIPRARHAVWEVYTGEQLPR
jgi:DNA-binding GntR family transcriptional regulator